MFQSGLFTNVLGGTAEITLWGFFACIGTALVLGAALTNITMYRSNCSKSFAVTIALFPLTVCTIVLLVSDNFGAGLAIAGAFSLIRFRSASGAAKEITALFISVAIGIACGMGYLGIAVFFSLIVFVLFFVYSNTGLWEEHKDDDRYRLTVFCTLHGSGAEPLSQVEEILNTCTSGYKKEKVTVTRKKKKKKAEIVYLLKISSAQEELEKALKNANEKFSFTLEKKNKADVRRL